MSILDVAVIKRNAIAFWNENPMNRPVKITSIERETVFFTEGYITSYKFICGRSLQEAENILGLRPGELESGAYLYEFVRFPTADEFDLRGYTQTPGGQEWGPTSEYPVGMGAAQWEVKKNTYIPSTIMAIIYKGGQIP